VYLCVYVVYVIDLIVPLTAVKKRCYVVIHHGDGKLCYGNVYCLLRTVRIPRSAGDVPPRFRTLITTFQMLLHQRVTTPAGYDPETLCPCDIAPAVRYVRDLTPTLVSM
jgi:hypothetical protein